MTRTVILACSATKRKDTCELSALARYDGPAWRTLRANLTCMVEPPLALSAEFGLISAYQEIPDYDRKLDGPRVRELIDRVYHQILELVEQGRLRGEIFAYGGRYYRSLLEQAIELAEMGLDRDIPVTYSSGGIGEQLGQLKDFLTKTPRPALAVEDFEDELERLAASAAPRGYISRRCLVCASLNPCREHTIEDQRAELARNDRAIARIREEAGE